MSTLNRRSFLASSTAVLADPVGAFGRFSSALSAGGRCGTMIALPGETASGSAGEQPDKG
jgi:hypothetical protein